MFHLVEEKLKILSVQVFTHIPCFLLFLVFWKLLVCWTNNHQNKNHCLCLCLPLQADEHFVI